MSDENEPLPDLGRARTEFVADISRQFRIPLTLLLGPLQDILDSPASAVAPASRIVLEDARRNALRLLTLLDTFPAAAGVERGPAGAGSQPADLCVFTTELASHFRPASDAAGLALIVDCPPLPEPLDFDRDVWEKVVVNLIAHAFKSTTAGTIEVRLWAHDGQAQLVVSDTGGGIAESELPYLFAGSERVGFGLPLVRELVRRHNGSIDVQSTIGLGTTFTVTLPAGSAAPSPHPDDRRPKDAATPAIARSGSGGADEWPAASDAIPAFAHERSTVASRGSRGHVVIAEDHDETRLYLGYVLETAGFTVDLLADGIAALTACQTKAPDALVSDVLMPGLDGFQLIERLRGDERTAVIPVLLLSARGGEDSRIEGIAAGADDYLVKPLSGRELVARVDGAVRLARLRRETAWREQERVRELSGRLVEVQEAERRDLSTELHDRTSPQLAAIQINLGMLNTLLGRETEDVRALLDDTAGLVADTTVGIREISANLRPTVLDDGGLLPALSGYAQQFEQRTGIAVQLDTHDATSAVTPAIQSSLFRIVQEALTNCAKHAKARNVTIELRTDEEHHVSLVIADDGVGFDVDPHSRSGLGLLTMRERAEFHGGRFSLETTPGRGTRISVFV
jgi:signal transduction histidine kinase